MNEISNAGGDPDGCRSTIIALLVEVVILTIIVTAWVLFR